jgi:hypothetical protein
LIGSDYSGPPIHINLVENIPFALELRCVIDFLFMDTALDPFQHWQCFAYLKELYKNKLDNEWYGEKTLGKPVIIDDRIQGWLCCVIYLILIMGPFIAFSELDSYLIK